MTTINVTGRYVGGALWAPKKRGEGDRRTYNAVIVLDKANAAKVEKARAEAIADQWGTKPPAGMVDHTLRFGDDPDYDHSYQQYFINPGAQEDRPPQVVRRSGGAFVVTTKEDGVVYPGCNVAASIDVYAYDANRDKGIKAGVTCGLRMLAFLSDGPRLDNAPTDATKEFEGIEFDGGEDDDFFGTGRAA